MIFNKKTKRGASRKPVRKERQPIVWQDLMKQLFAVVFIMVSVASTVYLVQDDTLPILHVTVEGDFKHVDRDQFVAAVSPYARGSFMNIDVASLRQAGEALPWVKQLQIRRVWPDSLHFIVEEHHAIAQWQDNGLISSEGKLFFPPKNSFPESLTVLTGPEQNHLMVAKRYLKLQSILNKQNLTLARVDMDGRRAWSLSFTNGINVKLGRDDNDKRFERFLKVYEHSLKDLQEQIVAMDMRYTNGLAVQWKNDKKPEFNKKV